MGLPSLSDTITPLAIIDGVTIPFSLDEALTSGKIIDVPLIVGNMHEESDIAPQQIVMNYTKEHYEDFIKQKFAPFGNNLGEKILELYPTNSFLSTQQSYDSISADLGVICGNIEFVKKAVKVLKSPVYHYIATQFPSSPECLIDFPFYCSQYAFHAWDLITMLADFEWLFHLSYQDKLFGFNLYGHFIDFANTGMVTAYAWKPFNAAPDYPNSTYTTNLSLTEKLWVNAKKEKCEFWISNGFNETRWWRN